MLIVQQAVIAWLWIEVWVYKLLLALLTGLYELCNFRFDCLNVTSLEDRVLCLFGHRLLLDGGLIWLWPRPYLLQLLLQEFDLLLPFFVGLRSLHVLNGLFCRRVSSDRGYIGHDIFHRWGLALKLVGWR